MLSSPRLPDDRTALPDAAEPVLVQRWHVGSAAEVATDFLAAEVPVALEVNGIAYATMLATPADLPDFARGFALTEGLIEHPGEIYGIEVHTVPDGVVIQLEIATARAVGMRERRRALAGRTGCGLCGVESLSQVVRPLAPLAAAPGVSLAAVVRAMQQMAGQQPLHQQTGATHAAGLASLAGDLLCVREDVGRHNALDKLIGATAGRCDPGLVVVSSRASFEMVQKTLAARHLLLAAVSAPTALAARLAEENQLLLLGFVRGERATAYAGAARLLP